MFQTLQYIFSKWYVFFGIWFLGVTWLAMLKETIVIRIDTTKVTYETKVPASTQNIL